jgi:hypothetical protein
MKFSQAEGDLRPAFQATPSPPALRPREQFCEIGGKYAKKEDLFCQWNWQFRNQILQTIRIKQTEDHSDPFILFEKIKLRFGIGITRNRDAASTTENLLPSSCGAFLLKLHFYHASADRPHQTRGFRM